MRILKSAFFSFSPFPPFPLLPLLPTIPTRTHPLRRFIASAGTYANLVRQAKSKQKIIDKMEAAGLVEKVETPRPLRFNFEDIRKLPPPIIAFNEVAFSYSGKKEDYLYRGLSFGIEYVFIFTINAGSFFANASSAAWTLVSQFLEPTARASQRFST